MRRTRNAILAILAKRPCTFGEVQRELHKLQSKEVASSPTTLGKHLKQLEDEGIVKPQINYEKTDKNRKRRIEYALTNEGEQMWKSRNPLIVIPDFVAEFFSTDLKSATFLDDFAKLAKRDPATVDRLLQLYQEAMIFLAREDLIKGLQNLPEEQARVFLAEKFPSSIRTLPTLGNTGKFVEEFTKLLEAFVRDLDAVTMKPSQGDATL